MFSLNHTPNSLLHFSVSIGLPTRNSDGYSLNHFTDCYPDCKPTQTLHLLPTPCPPPSLTSFTLWLLPFSSNCYHSTPHPLLEIPSTTVSTYVRKEHKDELIRVCLIITSLRGESVCLQNLPSDDSVSFACLKKILHFSLLILFGRVKQHTWSLLKRMNTDEHANTISRKEKESKRSRHTNSGTKAIQRQKREM